MYDVIVAGAGPVGLFLAGELGLRGVSVLVLEREAEPRSPLKGLPFGRRGLSMATAEALDRRGLLEEVKQSELVGGGQPGHFAHVALDPAKIDRSRWGYHLPSPADSNLAVTTEQLESILSAHAISMGAQVVRGQGVEEVEAGEEGVTVVAGAESFRARWLVGCDGGRSVVRKRCGFEWSGTEPEFTGYSVQVEFADAVPLPMGRHTTPSGMFFQSRPGTLAMAFFDGGASHRKGPTTLEQVQSVLRQVSGLDVRLSELRLATTWTDRSFQATSYRKGRVLLAGDAAHIHSPLGGQGLNLGLGDAMNLGWKLAAVVAGAPEALLDSYTRERHPVAAQVLDWSRAQVALMRPSPSSRALAAIVRDLMETDDGCNYFAERISGLSLAYDLDDPHPLAGRSAPDFTSTSRLAVLLREGKPVLLDFDGRPQLRELAEGHALVYVAGPPPDRLGLSAVLVRPDGFVAWVAEVEPEWDRLIQLLSQWSGGRPGAFRL